MYVSSGQSLYHYHGLKPPAQPLCSNRRIEPASNQLLSHAHSPVSTIQRLGINDDQPPVSTIHRLSINDDQPQLLAPLSYTSFTIIHSLVNNVQQYQQYWWKLVPCHCSSNRALLRWVLQ